jgi:Mg2+ and Co2+ transporter CorA
MSDDTEKEIRAIMEKRAELRRLRGATFDVAAVLERIELARHQTSSADDELRSQLQGARDRIEFVIAQIDELDAQFRQSQAKLSARR